jgi:uracil-DNA glycosylase
MSQNIQAPHPGFQFSHILSQFYDYLSFYQELGFEGIPKVPHHAAPSAPSSLDELEQRSQHCQSCSLHTERSHVVFGTGNPHARLVFIGDVPGIEDERQGIPFSGEAGDLLTRIIEAIELRRENVYLCNIMKCRPASGGHPEETEIARCLTLLHQQIDRIQPKIICALGTLAAQSLLGTNETIVQLRGRFHRYRDILVMPTYHPAHLLEHPEDKRQVWNDMQMIQKAYHEAGDDV